jgi:two-component system phosphate regulon sensor histidine kinase PhoR
MNKQVKKIGLILLLIILLPAVIFITFEISSLDENEKLVEDIYRNQLEAILYSVNQYSEDAASTWANKIDMLFADWGTSNRSFNSSECDDFINENRSITGIFKADTSSSGQKIFYPAFTNGNFNFFKNTDFQDSVVNKISSILDSNKLEINRLLTYQTGGYRKLLPVKSGDESGESILLFASRSSDQRQCLYGIVLNAKTFIEYVLSPKMQEIARDEFIISVSKNKNNELIYSTENINKNLIQQERTLWLLSEYSLGISLKGITIDNIVNERMTVNLILIFVLILTLVIGAWIIFRNVKREVEFAQIKSDFVSNVSHELRTPLALISMFAETLEMDRVKTEAKKKEYYTIISHEANRLGRIVNTILNFSRMEAGKRKFNFAEEDLNEVAVLVYQNYSYHLFNKGFDFEFEPGIDLPKVLIDREAVSEALVNLIDNAVKYSGDTKFIKMVTRFENDFVSVEVQDKGIGISEEDQKKVFDKFYRVPTGLVHTTKGTGLGLSLVKQIMDAHHGKIELRSKFGEGSNFKLIFLKNSQLPNGEKNG